MQYCPIKQPLKALPILAVMLLVFVGCARQDTPTESAPPYTDIEGAVQRLRDYQGQWLVVNYWATWCAPCVEELPLLQAFHDAMAGKGQVVGVNYEPPERIDNARISAFLATLGVTFPQWRPKALNNITPFGAMRGLPTTYVIAPNGELAAEKAGKIDREWLDNAVAAHNEAHNK